MTPARSHPTPRPWTAAVAAALIALPAAGQVYVGPRRPGQSSLRTTHQVWHVATLLDGETFDGLDIEAPEDGAAGIRLYFYDAEREVAERAAAAIEQAYGELVEAFGYVPERRVPYVLYSTYLDFLGTNLFPVQEGTLGVTSTRDLTIALPYFGDHRRFVHVGKHEMAHEFTIQKVRSEARRQGASRDPLAVFPLWFVEGLAEYYAWGRIPGEAAMLGRDLVVNADIRRSWGPLGFFDDAPFSVLWTYQVGHLRVAFLEETYGEGTLQSLLERAPELSIRGADGVGIHQGFPGLVERVTGDPPDLVERRFHRWLRERTYTGWLDAETHPEDLVPLDPTKGYTLSLATNADGTLLATTAIDFETGRTRIFLTDTRDPAHIRRVASDGRPGSESLHPIEGHTVAVGDEVVVWSARSRGADVLAWRRIRRDVRELPSPDDDAVDVRIRLSPTRRLPLADHGLVGATGLSLSPDGSRLAFVGLTPDGRTDLYVVPLAEDATPSRLTDDPFAERHTAWTRAGIVYASDATDHGHFNLFRIAPSGGPPTRLTGEARDHLEPVATDDGVVFSAWDGQRLDLYRLEDGGIRRLTRITTALSSPGAADDGAWALLQDGGARIPVHVPATAWGGDPPVPQTPSGAPAPRPVRPLDLADRYRPIDPRNWRIDNTLGYFGAGAGGLYGQLFVQASDHLRDRGLVLQAAAFGNLRLSDGYLAYIDRSRRATIAGGLFQSLRFRIDRTFDDLWFQSAERSYGVLASVRHPFHRYAYVQVDANVGGTQYFLFGGTEDFLAGRIDPRTGDDALEVWQRKNGRARPSGEITVRFGYDTVRYHPTTGPHGGGSVLLEGAWSVQPFDGQGFGHLRLDAERYAPIRIPAISGANVGIRAAAGTSGGGRYARNFFLSSFDTLRGVPFGDADRLLGRHFAWASAEVQIPVDAVLRVAVLSSVEAIAGVDAGAVSTDLDGLWDQRVADVALGTNLILGPLVFRVHFARPLDLGNPPPVPGDRPWVPNLSLRWLSL